MTARYVIGIDLGTSNSALAYADLEEASGAGAREARENGAAPAAVSRPSGAAPHKASGAGAREARENGAAPAAVSRPIGAAPHKARGAAPLIRVLSIPQLVAPGDVQLRTLLPSARYEPARFELPEGQDTLPWPQDPPSGDRPRPIIGEAARRLGAKTPVRLIESAKSWLCHGGVNRTAAILPWHAPEEVPKSSPVEVSASYLAHLRSAWDQQIAAGDETKRLVAQAVVITVPASFDEVARRLTLEAAKRAGYGEVTLIEEPLAAFYAFVARTGGTTEATGLRPGERVLIADVGGGTSDFTLIDVRAPKREGEGEPLEFERTAVGDHLLLGGDNMDLALAHALEPELSRGKKLDAEAWSQLKLEARLAKEALFTDPSRPSLPVVIAGRGSKLIGGSLRAELHQDRLQQVVVEGFFPRLPPGEAARPSAPAQRTGFAEFGLPFAHDPAITRHLAAFLLRHAAPGEPMAHADALLYNGGALKPVVVRDRLSQAIGEWMRASGRPDAPDPRPLIYDQGEDALELAVARGAAYFGLVRAGAGLKVGGGAPRAYYLGLAPEGAEGAEGGEPVPDDRVQVLCVAPRGMQDGQQLEVSTRDFVLITNRPVEFPLFTSTGPTAHPVGEVAVLSREELHELLPLQTVVRFGKQKAGTEVPVRIQARRTEVGTLELSCFSKMSGARFKLEFEVGRTETQHASIPPLAGGAGARSSEPARAATAFGGAGAKAAPELGDVPPEKLDRAKDRIGKTFAAEPPRLDPDPLMKGLEADLELSRDDIPLPAIRALAEHLLELADRRTLSPEHEARWLNVVGFCLRPGSGFPLDDWRVRQLWKIHASGVKYAGRDPSELNWWILWRRVSAGLGRGHQEELASILMPLLIPALAKRAKRRPPRPKTQEAIEMWRCAASLEQIAAKSRAQLGDALLELIAERKAPKSALWCLGRLGARRLLYGPREATVRRETVEGWVDRLLKLDPKVLEEDATEALISMGRLIGDRQFDLDEEHRKALAAALVARGLPEPLVLPLRELVAMDAAAERAAFGEGLPTGLKLA
ncbi:MAG: Hsp70 family protein [Deltaproteobacteria bacterium]|nr:Hsp70 family protein [Deltaproteobacteria bacterium]